MANERFWESFDAEVGHRRQTTLALKALKGLDSIDLIDSGQLKGIGLISDQETEPTPCLFVSDPGLCGQKIEGALVAALTLLPKALTSPGVGSGISLKRGEGAVGTLGALVVNDERKCALTAAHVVCSSIGCPILYNHSPGYDQTELGTPTCDLTSRLNGTRFSPTKADVALVPLSENCDLSTYCACCGSQKLRARPRAVLPFDHGRSVAWCVGGKRFEKRIVISQLLALSTLGCDGEEIWIDNLFGVRLGSEDKFDPEGHSGAIAAIDGIPVGIVTARAELFYRNQFWKRVVLFSSLVEVEDELTLGSELRFLGGS